MFTPQVIFQIILFFFVLVTIHEWGHFYFAKRAGILVREFAIGFGPKLFSFKRGETRYTLRLLPIGGFVRMAGEDPEIVQIQPGQTIGIRLDGRTVTHLVLDRLENRTDLVIGTVQFIDIEEALRLEIEHDGAVEHYSVHPQAMMVAREKENQIAPLDRQFGSKTVGQRALAIFAGPFMNFVLAFVLFVTVVFLTGVAQNVKIDGVEADSPAQKAGLLAGDIIKQVDNTTIGSSSRPLINLIQASPDKKMQWVVDRAGKEVKLEVTPTNNNGTILVGVRLISDKRSASFGDAISIGWSTMSDAARNILQGFKMLVLGQFKMEDLGGPVKIIQVTGEHASAGLPQYIFWAAIMSLYLGMFNLLPFPALDGSRILFLIFEAIRGKPVDPNRESMVHFIGFAMLMLLMIAVTYNDILQLIRG
ncbi:RIP metalloprotease RseP [Paenibacillus sp. y28]|uniref:RIP metalloprotease RseP n=1 Tax=Paenibacillus sp. y28 TaxID=3129110 RepID=UPI00301AA825